MRWHRKSEIDQNAEGQVEAEKALDKAEKDLKRAETQGREVQKAITDLRRSVDRDVDEMARAIRQALGGTA